MDDHTFEPFSVVVGFEVGEEKHFAPVSKIQTCPKPIMAAPSSATLYGDPAELRQTQGAVLSFCVVMDEYTEHRIPSINQRFLGEVTSSESVDCFSDHRNLGQWLFLACVQRALLWTHVSHAFWQSDVDWEA